MRLYFDIETLPSLAPDAREIARQQVKVPGTYKKPESIAAWWETEGEAAIEEAFRKQALDAASGELCALGFAADDVDPVSLVRGNDEAEADFIRRALSGVQDLINAGGVTGPDGRAWPMEPFFIGHNAGGFDLPFLWRRCVVHGIRPSFKLPGPSSRDGKDYGDTMTAWAGFRGTIGLDRLCRALKVPSPKASGMDGGQVYDLWLAGNHGAIATYNAADVEAVRAIWYRLNLESAA